MSEFSVEVTAVLEKFLPDRYQDWGQRQIEFGLEVVDTIREQGRVSEKQKDALNKIHMDIGARS